MKKKFEAVKIEIRFIEAQDIVTSSGYVQWDSENWNGKYEDYIFG